MSTLKGAKLNKNVAAFLLAALSEEDANVVTAEEELAKHLAAVEHHKERALMLREALEALGAEPDRPEGLREL